MDQIRRHVNGGAQKVGSEVHVSADSFCSYVSVLRGRTSIFKSELLDAKLTDCQSFESVLEFVAAKDSVFSGSRAVGLYAEGVTLDRVKVEITAPGEICTPITLVDVIAENCELYGNWTLDGNARIPTGIWHRAPRFKRITGENNVDVGLTESTDGYALMACWRKPITKWLAYGPRLGIKHGWTSQQIEDARLFFQELLDVPIEGVIPSAT